MQKFNLVAGQQLLLERGNSEDVILLSDQDGQVQLSIVVTPAGPVLKIEGLQLLIQASGSLAIDAEQVAIRGRKGVFIDSGSNVRLSAASDMELEASVNNIKATLGNVNILANDDVKLNGERIKLNC